MSACRSNTIDIKVAFAYAHIAEDHCVACETTDGRDVTLGRHTGRTSNTLPASGSCFESRWMNTCATIASGSSTAADLKATLNFVAYHVDCALLLLAPAEFVGKQ